MRIVLQRVSHARVDITDEDYSAAIDHGYVLLLGITHEDKERHADVLIDKLIKLRIWPDDEGKMNRTILDVDGSMLVISQFTLYADMKKGNRPSYMLAARPELANKLYEYFVSRLRTVFSGTVKTGLFGKNMQIMMTNDGPVTLTLDTEDWKHKIV